MKKYMVQPPIHLISFLKKKSKWRLTFRPAFALKMIFTAGGRNCNSPVSLDNPPECDCSAEEVNIQVNTHLLLPLISATGPQIISKC